MPLEDINRTNRLLHDLAAVGRMQAERASAAQRVEAIIGGELAAVVRASLAAEPGRGGGLLPRRAA